MRAPFRLNLIALAILASSSPAWAAGSHHSLSFSEVSVPTTDAEKREIRASSEVTVDNKSYPIGYHTLVRTKQQLPLLGDSSKTAVFGALIDKNGDPFVDEDGSNLVCTNGSGPDHTSLLSRFGKLYAVTQLECAVGGAYVTALDQDRDGLLTATATRPVDFSGEFGTYVNCAGVTTPWDTHLGSEEYEPPMALFNPTPTVEPYWFGDTASDGWHDDHIAAIAAYNGLANNAVNGAHIGYYYGWIPEISIISSAGDTEVVKHYAMGRFSHELAYVMPDNRTVYLSDDGTNVGLFMFVADGARDLSAGTLYAAKWVQQSADDGGSADIHWINLGHATDAEIRAALTDTSVTFDTMWEKETMNSDGSCPTGGFTPTNTYDVGKLCVKLKDGMDKFASRLETRLYAAYEGATTEFRKEEGITYDSDHDLLYVSMSQVAKGMEDGSSNDVGGNNDIRLPKNNCGTVFGLSVTKGIKDSEGVAIASTLVATNMYGVISGTAHDYSGTEYENNDCDIDGIANPDNLSYLPKYGTLLIGEDTDSHQNDYVWAYDVNAAEKTRIVTTPYGSETTSTFWHPNIKGFGYATLVVQHPYGESDSDKANPGDQESYVGYIGPFPRLTLPPTEVGHGSGVGTRGTRGTRSAPSRP